MTEPTHQFKIGVHEGLLALKDRIARVGSEDVDRVLKKFTRNLDARGEAAGMRRLGYLCGLVTGVNALEGLELELRRPEQGISEWSLKPTDQTN